MSENVKEGSDGEYSIDDEGQLQPQDSLVDRGVDDILDEGLSPPEQPIGIDAFGTTDAEQREGESLERKLSKELPEVPLAADDDAAPQFRPVGEEVGNQRAGRLLAEDEGVGEDTESELVAEDVGIDGAAASAEEAAVHVIDEP